MYLNVYCRSIFMSDLDSWDSVDGCTRQRPYKTARWSASALDELVNLRDSLRSRLFLMLFYWEFDVTESDYCPRCLLSFTLPRWLRTVSTAMVASSLMNSQTVTPIRGREKSPVFPSLVYRETPAERPSITKFYHFILILTLLDSLSSKTCEDGC